MEPRRIFVMSNKGGVGKTTVAVNLALALSRKGLRVGLLDVDIHGPNAPKMLGLRGRPTEENGKLLPISFEKLKVMSMGFLMEDGEAAILRGPMKHKIIGQFLNDVEWGELDYLVIDFPPGTGDEAITLSQVPGKALIVSTPQEVAVFDALKAVAFAKKVNIPILGLVENMAGEVFGEGGLEKAAREKGLPFLGRIMMDSGIRKACDQGVPAKGAFDEIADKVLELG